MVEKFINAGYKQDIRKEQYNYFSSFTFEDIVDFYRQECVRETLQLSLFLEIPEALT